MRITRIRLNGFKSFVDPTDLVIADGLTGIVGPNGCGKSNLLEALRWVMGETRPSAMRGGGMEDVIFAGAATRPARNFAEVALSIDNAERLAPAGFNDADQLEVVRRITRDAGSAYRLQGREVRARDVQMLFADASTGAHSPALVRQGQIAELINARPVARRRILEEAAGIAGLYQRRHEAELKLKAAEQNLLRVDDVVEQLAQQLGQLARQARAAARYREIGAALRRSEALLLWRRWTDAGAAAATAAAALRDRSGAAAWAEAAATAASEARASAEAALPPLREEEAIAGAVLGRLGIEQATLAEEARQAAARIARLKAQIAQLQVDAEREAQLNRDADDTLERLQREAAEIAAATAGQEDRLAAATDAAHAAAAALAEVEAAQGRLAEDAARLAARHQSAERLVADCRQRQDRAAAELEMAEAAQQAAAQAQAAAESECEAARAAEDQAAATAARAEEVLAEAEDARAETQGREADARAARSAAEGEAAALRAELGALARLVDRDGAAGGQVLDLLQVAPGFERALGAALGDDLRAPADPAPGRTGWMALPPLQAVPALPGDIAPLAEVVDGPGVLSRRLAAVGVVDAADGARLQPILAPGQRLVSREGDLWRWDGFHVAAADAPSAAALRLQQLNRLVELKRDLEEAQARADGAALAHDHLGRRLAALTEADQRARGARREAERLLTEAQRRLSRAEAELRLAEGRCEATHLALARHDDEAVATRDALEAAAAALAELPDPAAARAAAEAARREVDAARDAMLARRAAHDDLRRQGEARARRAEAIARDIAAWTRRQDTAATRSAELAEREADLRDELAEAADQPAGIATRSAVLADEIDRADRRRARAADALALAEETRRTAQTAEREAERQAGEAREARARAEAQDEAARAALAEAALRIEETLDMTPAALVADLRPDPDAVPDIAALEAETAMLRRQREALGAVNLRAEEDARSVQEDHDRLIREKADLEEAIRALRGGIGSLNREGRERLLTAFEQVNGNFAMLFRHLFGGGEARLELVESDDPLEAGLEIMCQPPGKKLSTLSLLSGGEQTLTALALIFAVFLANPAPICVLDEVDAPLDDANVTRFCDLMDEMTRRTETRFLVITHHAVTMSRMDRLFGVTMAEPGVSQLVSVDLRRAAALVA